MLLIYILLSYLIGYFMMLDTLKTNGHLIVMDILMFIAAPSNLFIIILLKVTSYFFALDKVIINNNPD